MSLKRPLSCLPARPREDSPAGPGPASQSVHHHLPLPEPGAPSAARSCSATSCSHTRPASQAATGTPALPPVAQLLTCFHGRLRRPLDPRTCPAIRQSSRATCHLSTSATERSTSTPINVPDLAAVATTEAAARTSDNAPFETLSTELSQARGHTRSERALNPHRGDRSPRWIYPNLIDPGTSCR